MAPRKKPSGKVTVLPAVSKPDREYLEEPIGGTPEGISVADAIIDAGWRPLFLSRGKKPRTKAA
jgi:hypothetical protein